MIFKRKKSIADILKLESERYSNIKPPTKQKKSKRVKDDDLDTEDDDIVIEKGNIIINQNGKQYKALLKRLADIDNEKTDAVRMALYYLESKGKFSIDKLEKYLIDE